MNAAESTTISLPFSTPFGKVFGIVENQEMFQAVSAAWKTLGVSDLENLNGPLGTAKLETEKKDVIGCMFGDMELVTIQRYLTAVKDGQIVFAASVESNQVESAAEVAKSLGASDLVHFGSLVIRSY